MQLNHMFHPHIVLTSAKFLQNIQLDLVDDGCLCKVLKTVT